MGIFSKIKDAIFGHKAQAAPAPAPAPQAAAPAPVETPIAQTAAPQPVAIDAVDVAAILDNLASNNSQKLNWKVSIVDLMKLLGLDSSLENRKELAGELGFTGDTNDSASMNIWLHKAVMNELAKNGGVVPDDLK
ncbi:DUF3597 domain-containing protein [Pseudaquidulcibacter saccharophilus]|uniref:DUF3597 domain-containing protein n=1 Tax=Pseudaquidulcibacter saccharophilus TaxID=2831900 RepID=UPI001EFF2ACF|nr:DUF3597 domain-containing protein [Pseudaquidulcibacter saccharophilus]